jgi:hypothetical protein
MNTPKEAVVAARRKLMALEAVTSDAAATENERANAAALKPRLERRLKEGGAPAGDWTDMLFRLGRRAKKIRKSASAAPVKGDWTDNAYRLGEAVRRGFERWRGR